MKVGLFLTNQQYLSTDMVSALDEQITMVRLIRDKGWDSLFSGQHYLNEGDNQQLQLVPLLARLIPEAGDMQVGLGILLLNLHNPVYTAETVATLDVLARGNFVFGVGLGYRDVEFDAFAVPKGQRVSRFEEYLNLIVRLWTEDSVTHHSETCRLTNVRMNLRPVQKPRPPDLDRGQQRLCRQKGGTHGGRVDNQSPFQGGNHQEADGDLHRHPERERQTFTIGTACNQGIVLRGRSENSP